MQAGHPEEKENRSDLRYQSRYKTPDPCQLAGIFLCSSERSITNILYTKILNVNF